MVFLTLVIHCRAVHGDVVAVELLPKSEWSAPSGIIRHDFEDDDEELQGMPHVLLVPLNSNPCLRLNGIVCLQLGP